MMMMTMMTMMMMMMMKDDDDEADMIPNPSPKLRTNLTQTQIPTLNPKPKAMA